MSVVMCFLVWKTRSVHFLQTFFCIVNLQLNCCYTVQHRTSCFFSRSLLYCTCLIACIHVTPAHVFLLMSHRRTGTSNTSCTLSVVIGLSCVFLGHLLRDDLINPVKMSVCTSVRPSIRTSTMKHNAATNQIVIFVKIDETFMTIWLSRSSEVRVKVTWDWNFLKWRFSNSISAIFNQSKKFHRFLRLDQNI